ncbi:MAG: hypothetical protein B6U97_04005 [Candidatus Altiarchaeales archaeon ex4484_96]|nr:MAG: hypothetical protein B6U97_04005 [Candidatus Altiarchaeales archaeon ex4484_96]
MKVVGLDLAGKPVNDSGFCVLSVEGESKHVLVKVLHSDEEIINELEHIKPELTAVDAPLIYSGKNRKCDVDLSSYGALPVTLRGMEVLALRGAHLALELKDSGFDLIEVHAAACAKILGYYDRDEKKVQKSLLESGLKGDIEKRFLSRDELDAVFSALTAFLHLKKSTRQVGDEEGVIVVPGV